MATIAYFPLPSQSYQCSRHSRRSPLTAWDLSFFCCRELVRFLFGKHDIPGRRRARVASRSHVAHSRAREFRGRACECVRCCTTSYVADTEDGIAQTSRHDTVLAQSLISLRMCPRVRGDRLLLVGNIARPRNELDVLCRNIHSNSRSAGLVNICLVDHSRFQRTSVFPERIL